MWDESFDKYNDDWSLSKDIRRTNYRNCLAMKNITFENDGETFHVNSKARHGIFTLKMEEGFSYKDTLPFVFIAVNLSTGKNEHCVILTTEKEWVKTSLELGKKVISQFKIKDN